MRLSAPIALAIVASILGCAPVPEPPGPPRRVLLITIDTLRADHLGAYGYPRDTTPQLDRLAERGVLFEQAFAQWPKTGSSFASIFTGRYPSSTGLTHRAAQRIPEAYLTLPAYFAAQGYTNVAVVSNAILNRELNWHRGFAEYLETWLPDGADGVTDEPQLLRSSLLAPRVNELALPLLARHRDAERLFAWIHYSDPHGPYILPEGVDNAFLGDALYDEEELLPPDLKTPYLIDQRRELGFYLAQYDANIRVADAAIGELLAHAEELGLLEDALVVVTSDHGESLGEHGYYFGHGRLPYNTTSRVPLIVVAPGRAAAGRRVSQPVELLDLYPSLVEALGGEAPSHGLEGGSLWPLLRGEPSDRFEHAFTEAGVQPASHYRSVQDAAGWKLVTVSRRRGAARQQLFRLADDPGEERDVAAAHPAEVERLRLALRRWAAERERSPRPDTEEQGHGEDTEHALRALGYVE